MLLTRCRIFFTDYTYAPVVQVHVLLKNIPWERNECHWAPVRPSSPPSPSRVPSQGGSCAIGDSPPLPRHLPSRVGRRVWSRYCSNLMLETLFTANYPVGIMKLQQLLGAQLALLSAQHCKRKVCCRRIVKVSLLETFPYNPNRWLISTSQVV